MKRLIVILMIISVVILCGCKTASNTGIDNTVASTNGNTTQIQDSRPGSNEPTNNSEFDNIDWESPIDVDESFSDIDVPSQPTEATEPTDGTTPTDPSETDPTEVPPAASETDPSEPEATKPQSKPGISTDPDTGAIQLPMIPG